MKQITCTLAMVVTDDRILLGLKKRSFATGYYNGFGGRVEAGETVEQAALRELTEECGIVATKYEKVGVIEFDEIFRGEHAWMTVHVFLITGFNGEPEETDEMRPEWFSLDAIPYDKMLPDDRHWLPLVLDGKKVKGFFHFDEHFNILEKRLEAVKDIE